MTPIIIINVEVPIPTWTMNILLSKPTIHHTGTYTANNGVQSAITSWSFVDAEKTQLLYTIAFSTPLIVNWENLQFATTSIKYGEYHNLNGINMSIVTRIPK